MCVCVCVFVREREREKECACVQDVLVQPDVFYFVRPVFSVLRYVCSEFPLLTIVLTSCAMEEGITPRISKPS